MSLETNPNAKDHKFYGKTIGEFTEEEKELFQVDLMMSMGFSFLLIIGKDNKELTDRLNELGMVRTTIIIDLLEIPEVMYKTMGFDKLTEIIEDSPYGYSKFLKSQDENIKEHQEEMDEVINDFKRESLMGNISYN
jgi:hypothetical protein